MEISVIQELIQSLGFPIVMVGYFIWDKTKVTNQLTDAINNNNTILTRLLERFDSWDIVKDVEK